MSGLRLTCDRANGLIRAAVWSGKMLLDLYVNRIENPDLSGAVVRGKVVRVLPGGKGGWIECGLKEKIYCESAVTLSAGSLCTLRIQSTLGQGKAWPGLLLDSAPADGLGVLTPPPLPWQTALANIDPQTPLTIHFKAREDYEAFEPAAHRSAQVEKEAVHPELDEILDALTLPTVPLSGGASLVIEPTQALVAIDVNAGEKGNPTEVNFLALREAARQIRLRNLSGLIVIDALKMKNRADKAKALNVLTRATASDPAGVQVYEMTKLGLIELTRTRRGPPLGAFIKEEGL